MPTFIVVANIEILYTALCGEGRCPEITVVATRKSGQRAQNIYFVSWQPNHWTTESTYNTIKMNRYMKNGERVFPAGVEPGSFSRHAAIWLSSRFSRSVQMRQQYGWLRMVLTRCASLPSTNNLIPLGRWWYAKGRGHCIGKPGLSSEYTPNSTRRAEGSSFVDEPGEC